MNDRKWPEVVELNFAWVTLIRMHDYVWDQRKNFTFSVRLRSCLTIWRCILSVREIFDAANCTLDDDEGQEIVKGIL